MPIALRHEHGDTYRLDISGKFLRDDAARCETELAGALRQTSSIKLLCVLDAFKGWERGAGDLSFYAKHGDAITRIAIVGNERWRSQALMFALADLRTAPVMYFDESDLSRARDWLSGPAAADKGIPHSKG